MSKDLFEAGGDRNDWPANEVGKPTHAAVFGISILSKPRRYEILWTGEFPDLHPAMYWAAKKEIAAIRTGRFEMASRVLWQHDLSPEQAVLTCFNDMQKQLDRIVDQHKKGEDLDPGDGPMQPIDHSKSAGHYIEAFDENDNTLLSTIIPNDDSAGDFDPQNPMANWLLPSALPPTNIPQDPRER